MAQDPGCAQNFGRIIYIDRAERHMLVIAQSAPRTPARTVSCATLAHARAPNMPPAALLSTPTRDSCSLLPAPRLSPLAHVSRAVVSLSRAHARSQPELPVNPFSRASLAAAKNQPVEGGILMLHDLQESENSRAALASAWRDYGSQVGACVCGARAQRRPAPPPPP